MSDSKDMLAFSDRKEKHKRIRRFLMTGGIATVVLFAVDFWVSLKYTAYSRLESLDAHAHSIYHYAEAWQVKGQMLTTHIARKSKSADPDSFTAYVSCDDYGHWYGVVCNTQGELMYTLYSWKQIPEQYLVAPPKKEDMLEMLRDPFQSGYAVGTWIPEDDTFLTKN